MLFFGSFANVSQHIMCVQIALHSVEFSHGIWWGKKIGSFKQAIKGQRVLCSAGKYLILEEILLLALSGQDKSILACSF